MSDSDIEKLNPRIGDVFPLIAQTALTALAPPLGFAAMVYSTYIGSPASRRAEQFLLSLDQRLTALEQEEKINKNELLQDPKFNTIVMHATQIAIRTHRKEKLGALKNTVINSINSDIDEDKQLIFLRILDTLTVFELKILYEAYNIELLDNKEENLALSIWIRYERKGFDYQTIMQAFNTLASNGLINQSVPGLSTGSLLSEAFNYIPQQLLYTRSSFGQEFLTFIGLPFSDNDES